MGRDVAAGKSSEVAPVGAKSLNDAEKKKKDTSRVMFSFVGICHKSASHCRQKITDDENK